MLASSRPVYCKHCCDDPVTQATKYFNKFIKERKEIYKPIELKYGLSYQTFSGKVSI